MPGWNGWPLPRGLMPDRMLSASVHAASGGPPFDPAAVPERVVLPADRRGLRLTWPAKPATDLAAAALRAACRCAWCTRERIEGTFSPALDAIAIVALAPIGDYAVNITFSDGHARGIYPWTYLRALAGTGDEAASSCGLRAAAPPHEGPAP
jgi:DUF971 family protein